jgi:hypothetical protein
MSDRDERFRSYFRRKIADWNIFDPSYNHRFYIRKKGKEGLTEELAKDKDFRTDVRDYVARLLTSEIQNPEVFRLALEDSISILQEEKEDSLRQSELETLLAAVLEACDFTNLKLGTSIIKRSLVTLVIATSLDAVLSTAHAEDELENAL